MATWDEIAHREVPCRKCRGTFRVHGRVADGHLSEIRRLLEAGEPISAIRLFREVTGADLRDAKGMFEHVTIRRGLCHECQAKLPAEILCECTSCGALNIDA